MSAVSWPLREAMTWPHKGIVMVLQDSRFLRRVETEGSASSISGWPSSDILFIGCRAYLSILASNATFN